MAEKPEEITIEEFGRLDLRVAVVREARAHPQADRLLLLRIDLGPLGERQIVAGIASQYRPEDLVGRRICVVCNLKPARLRGEISQGMLLAASDGETISLLGPDKEVAPGSPVH
jgi:methionyl-tRNA synthetase